MIPQKLKVGDEVRVISPATSLHVITPDQRRLANERLADLGLTVTYSAHAEECDEFSSSSVESRVADLHEAFADPNVKAILTTLGGFNSNQMLQYLDYDLIARNPKIFCGYSDITAIATAITVKTGLITYSGPHYSTFSMEKGFAYTLDYFRKCLFSEEPIDVTPSPDWSDDHWYLDQANRTFIENDGYTVLREGHAVGKIVGGNLCTLNLLQGTAYMPSLEDAVVLVEDDNYSNPHIFDRDLQSLLHQPGFDKVKALLIGRFQNASGVTDAALAAIIRSKRELDQIPVVTNVNFGHVSPIITFPIGGTIAVNAENGQVAIQIQKH